MSSNRPQRAERGPSGPLFFALVLLSLPFLPLYAADPILNWIKTPEAYYATPEELAQWKREVVSPQDAQRFINAYFEKRGEQFKKDLHTRIEVADDRFKLPKVPGSKTDMGRVAILLGPPNEQRSGRGATTQAATAGPNPMAGKMQDSALEQNANVLNTWVYKSDRLPAGLGMAELTINFVTDVARGKQYIENPGLVEPYLRKVAAHVSNQYAMAATSTRGPNVATAKPITGTSAPDPLWNLTPNPNGALYTGEAFVSPREAPFYAVNLFIPKDVAAFKEWKSGLLVSLIRDASGKEVLSQRTPVGLEAYDADGNRYVDRSFALAPGKYDAMFALYSPEGATLLSSYREQFEVPAANASRASKLLLSSRVDTLEKQDALDPFTFVATKYAVRGSRVFRTTDKITLFTVVSNPTGSPAPELMQKLSITKDGKSFAKMPLEPAQLTQTGPNTFLIGVAFDADTFKPGHYNVELQVRDFKAPEGSELRTKGYVVTNEFDVVK